MKDLDFVSARFVDFEIPKERLYLLKYFTNELQMAFLKYLMLFGSCRNFIDHTGYYCSERIQYRLLKRYRLLNKVYDEAKAKLDEDSMATISLIESGKFALTRRAI